MTRDHATRIQTSRRNAGRPSKAARALALGWILAGGTAVAQDQPIQTPQQRAMSRMTPIELFGEANFQVEMGKPEEAVPYLSAFSKAQVDDRTFLQLHDKYGPGALLRLRDFPDTAPFAATLLTREAEAQKNLATDPARLARLAGQLSATPAEQRYAIERLREAGPYAVPTILKALNNAGLGAAERSRVALNLGRLDASAVPPLIAALDSEDGPLTTAVAGALAAIGDRRAVPFLTALAAQADPDAPGQLASRKAIGRLTGQDYGAQPRSPVRTLVEEAWKYHRHQVDFPEGRVEVWDWDADRVQPVPRIVSAADAEGDLGLKMAREALKLDPADLGAQIVMASLALERSILRSGGLERFQAPDASGAFAAALASGPVVLGEVLKAAIADGKGELAAVAANALGRVTDRDGLAVAGRTSPLVEALSAPDRRVQFAAARALVELAPDRPFAGSSRVVPVLSRFLNDPTAPRAVVIDGNLARGNRTAAGLRKLGLDPMVSITGDEGFRLAADQADVELIVLDPANLQGAWRAIDTLTNLRADARTAGIPILVTIPIETGRYPAISEPVRPHPDVEPNNSQLTANPILYSGGIRRATIMGSLDSLDPAGDYFKLGNLDPGMSVHVVADVTEASRLTINDLAVTLEGTPDRLLVQADHGKATLDVASPDTYYLHVQAATGRRGPGATYRIDITLVDPVMIEFANERSLLKLEPILQGLPRVTPLALSTDPEVLRRQVLREMGRMGVRPLTDSERANYGRAAAQLLALIGQRPGSPYTSDLAKVGTPLAIALNSPTLAPLATQALGDVPGLDAQRGLADVVLDTGKDASLRIAAAGQLARSLGRFGPLVTDEQKRLLLQEFDREADPTLRTAFSLVIGSLRPSGATVGQRLKGFQLAPGDTPPAPEGEPMEPGGEPDKPSTDVEPTETP